MPVCPARGVVFVPNELAPVPMVNTSKATSPVV